MECEVGALIGLVARAPALCVPVAAVVRGHREPHFRPRGGESAEVDMVTREPQQPDRSWQRQDQG